MDEKEIVEAIRESKKQNAAEPHGLAYSPPLWIKAGDAQSRCNCGWTSKKTTSGRAFSAYLAHRRAALGGGR